LLPFGEEITLGYEEGEVQRDIALTGSFKKSIAMSREGV
jgi:hypothetical protein